jgi:hypothetical protein
MLRTVQSNVLLNPTYDSLASRFLMLLAGAGAGAGTIFRWKPTSLSSRRLRRLLDK